MVRQLDRPVAGVLHQIDVVAAQTAQIVVAGIAGDRVGERVADALTRFVGFCPRLK
jgi:hypothetical protein